ncbi:hypothetical protein [Microbulbifer discodermiae]|uniref:hypothetical protein n=1 Tax=Microbulbifer sp. 2201CG32-9 TaxID=3232309 RepID=UPI00345C2608
MENFKHLIEVDEESHSIKIYRIYNGGEKELYTETDLPEIDKDYDKLREFSQSLGESILCDFASVRKFYGL